MMLVSLANQNLSDLARHVCNTWVSIYNLIQDWNKEHVEGLRIITEFINTKLEILLVLCSLLPKIFNWF